jgi:AMP deaminase
MGLNTFDHRPHNGETGDPTHLISGFLFAQSIQHGIQLRLSPVLQYLYYLAQIGLAMGPTSNHYLWLDYHQQPFFDFYKMGMLLSINSDNPAQFGNSDYTLWGEYVSVLNQWRMSNADMCELARNSVIISDFPHEVTLYLRVMNIN